MFATAGFDYSLYAFRREKGIERRAESYTIGARLREYV